MSAYHAKPQADATVEEALIRLLGDGAFKDAGALHAQLPWRLRARVEVRAVQRLLRRLATAGRVARREGRPESFGVQ